MVKESNMMKRMLVCGAVAAAAVGLALAFGSTAGRAADEAGAKMLAHNVYFSLTDASPAARAKLVEACRKYLSGHPGTVFFAAGTVAADCDRPVNDRDFDVALHVVFRDKPSHDAYQKADRHLKFIEENQSNWKKVRVFDSYVGQ
jgi:hypothetical protein